MNGVAVFTSNSFGSFNFSFATLACPAYRAVWVAVTMAVTISRSSTGESRMLWTAPTAAETVEEACILQAMVAAALGMGNVRFSLTLELSQEVVRPVPLLLEFERRALAIGEQPPGGC